MCVWEDSNRLPQKLDYGLSGKQTQKSNLVGTLWLSDIHGGTPSAPLLCSLVMKRIMVSRPPSSCEQRDLSLTREGLSATPTSTRFQFVTDWSCLASGLNLQTATKAANLTLFVQTAERRGDFPTIKSKFFLFLPMARPRR